MHVYCFSLDLSDFKFVAAGTVIGQLKGPKALVVRYAVGSFLEQALGSEAQLQLPLKIAAGG